MSDGPSNVRSITEAPSAATQGGSPAPRGAAENQALAAGRGQTARHTDPDWGGLAGQAERLARHQARCSGHRREAWRARRAAHLRRLRWLTGPAIAGLVLLGWQITRDRPSYLLVMLGTLLVAAWLTEALHE